MSGQATGKRHHLPLRLRMYYNNGSHDALLFEARIGLSPVESLQDLGRRWRRGVDLNAVVAAGSQASKIMLDRNASLQADLSDGVHRVGSRISGLRFVSVTPVQPSAEQLTAAAPTQAAVFLMFHQVCARNDTIK